LLKNKTIISVDVQRGDSKLTCHRTAKLSPQTVLTFYFLFQLKPAVIKYQIAETAKKFGLYSICRNEVKEIAYLPDAGNIKAASSVAAAGAHSVGCPHFGSKSAPLVCQSEAHK